MIRAYICHPFANDPKGNVEKVRKIAEEIANESISIMSDRLNKVRPASISAVDQHNNNSDVVVPIVPLLLFPEFMSETGGVSREQALAFCLSLLEGCDEIWVCSGVVSEGMQIELSFAAEHGIKIVWRKSSLVYHTTVNSCLDTTVYNESAELWFGNL